MIEELKQDAKALPILLDWLGEGMEPVDYVTALIRANKCLAGNQGKKCPHNTAPNWWYKNFRNPIAKAILAQMELQKKHFKRFPPDIEKRLMMCSACGCSIRLKAFTPIHHIADHTTTDQLEQYPDFCWIPNEILQKGQLCNSEP